MLISRYVNGRRLHTVMPPVVLDDAALGALLREQYQQFPLSATENSVILQAEREAIT